MNSKPILLTEVKYEQPIQRPKTSCNPIYREVYTNYIKTLHLKVHSNLYSCLGADEQKEGILYTLYRRKRYIEWYVTAEPCYIKRNDRTS